MATILTTYDPKEVKIAWNGIDLSDALAPDTFINISRTEDSFAPTVGASGTGVRTRNANKMGQIDLTLMQNAPANNLLSAAALADEQAGAEVLSVITITDPSGSADFVIATDAYIRKVADVELGADYGTRTWNFDCMELQVVG
jgi:hypothetical protein